MVELYALQRIGSYRQTDRAEILLVTINESKQSPLFEIFQLRRNSITTAQNLSFFYAVFFICQIPFDKLLLQKF